MNETSRKRVTAPKSMKKKNRNTKHNWTSMRKVKAKMVDLNGWIISTTKVNVDGDDVFSYYHFRCLCLSHFLTPQQPDCRFFSHTYSYTRRRHSLSLLHTHSLTHFLFLLTLNAPTCHHISHRRFSFFAFLFVKFRRQTFEMKLRIRRVILCK